MKFNRIALLIFFTLVLPAHAYSQEPHVHTKYLKEVKQTRVYTDFMVAIDTPFQFLQVQFACRYPKQQLKKLPSRITLNISSHTRKVLYRRDDADRKFFIIADGESLRFSTTGYEMLKGETKNGKDRFLFERDGTLGFPKTPAEAILQEILTGRGYENTLPDNAQIRTDEDVTGMFLERIFVDVKSEQFLEIAKAQKIGLQLGSTKIDFTENQMNAIPTRATGGGPRFSLRWALP